MVQIGNTGIGNNVQVNTNKPKTGSTNSADSTDSTGSTTTKGSATGSFSSAGSAGSTGSAGSAGSLPPDLQKIYDDYKKGGLDSLTAAQREALDKMGLLKDTTQAERDSLIQKALEEQLRLKQSGKAEQDSLKNSFEAEKNAWLNEFKNSK